MKVSVGVLFSSLFVFVVCVSGTGIASGAGGYWDGIPPITVKTADVDYFRGKTHCPKTSPAQSSRKIFPHTGNWLSSPSRGGPSIKGFFCYRFTAPR